MSDFHDFQERYVEGKRGEAHLDLFYRTLEFTIVEVGRDRDRLGVDRIFKKDGKTHTIEYKTDSRAAATGNAFIETISVDRPPGRLSLGWSIKARADFLIYYVPPWNKLWQVSLRSIRVILPEWIERYRTIDSPNDGYRTWGVLVPFPEFAKLAGKVLDVPPMLKPLP